MRILRVTAVVFTFLFVLAGCGNFLEDMTYNIFADRDGFTPPGVEELNTMQLEDPEGFVDVVNAILDREGFTETELPDGVTRETVFNQLTEIYSNPAVDLEIRQKSALSAAALAVNGSDSTAEVVGGFADLIVDAVSGVLQDPTPGDIVLGLFGSGRDQTEIENNLADLRQAAAAYDFFLESDGIGLPPDDQQPAMIALLIDDIAAENGEAAVVSAIQSGDFTALVIDETLLTAPEQYSGNPNLADLVEVLNLEQFLGG